MKTDVTARRLERLEKDENEQEDEESSCQDRRIRGFKDWCAVFTRLPGKLRVDVISESPLEGDHSFENPVQPVLASWVSRVASDIVL